MKKEIKPLVGAAQKKKIDKYFASDVWDLRKCPTAAGTFFSACHVDRTLDFRKIPECPLKKQLKDYLQYFLQEGYVMFQRKNSLTSEFFRISYSAVDFLSHTDIQYNDILTDHDTILQAFIEYSTKHFPGSVGKKRSGGPCLPGNLINKLKDYYQEKKDASCGSLWERDIWYRDALPLDRTQVNLSSGPITVSFEHIQKEEDRKFFKRFEQHLLEDRKISFSSLVGYHHNIKRFLIWLNQRDLSIGTAQRDDILKYYEFLNNELKVSHSTFDTNASNIYALYEYLQLLTLINNCPVEFQDRFRDRYHYRLSTVDDEVIIQVFGILHTLPPYLINMFLLIFSTGMRISEACLIKNDCLIKNEKGCFVRYYCQKMKKDVMSIISPALYARLEDAVNSNAKLTWKQEYLFWRTPNKPLQTTYFRIQFQDAVARYNIKNPDGTPYIFRPHDLRHTIATKLYKSGSTIAVIQKVLHHVSVEMSLAYIECDDDYMKQQHAKYLNYRGEEIPLEKDTERLHWLRQNINSQALSNGMCTLPVTMGKCPHCNACLDGCPYFQTSPEFLDIHKEHLKGIEEYITQCQEHGWTNQLEGAQRVRDNLIAIIGRLEK